MKTRLHIVALGVCVACALGVPVAQAKLQAQLVSENGSFALAQARSGQSTLAAMRKAGTSYHANAKAESLQTELVSENGSFVLTQTRSSHSTLAAMKEAGTSYHATAKSKSTHSLPSHTYDKPIG
jgi:hypothetical protein